MTHSYTNEDIIKDVKKVAKILDKEGKLLTRPNYLSHGKYGIVIIGNRFGGWKPLMGKMGLEVQKEYKQVIKAIGKHTQMDIYRHYYKDKVTPWCGKYAKKEKTKGIAEILIGSDMHDEDVDEFTLAVFIDTARRKQPDIICLNGDIFDCYEFSRYTKDPRQCDTARRFQFVHDEIFAPLRKACPKAQIDLIVGNHEYRLLKKLAENNPHLMVLMSDFMGLSLKDFFGLDKYKINLTCKSDLATWSKKDEKNELKKNFKKYYGCYVVSHERDFGYKMHGSSGHTHTANIKADKSIEGSKLWYTFPGMVIRDADYMENISRADCGFGLVHIDLATKDVQQEMFITSGSFVSVGAKVYKR